MSKKRVGVYVCTLDTIPLKGIITIVKGLYSLTIINISNLTMDEIFPDSWRISNILDG